jgi:hypothetical protein
MILDEFTGRNCKRTEYIDARSRHWIVRTAPVFVERKLDRYETTLLLQLEHCNSPCRRAVSATKERALMKHDGFVARLQRAEADQLNKAIYP